MVLRKVKFAFAALLCVCSLFANAQEKLKKTALVIGNASYTQSNALKNPVRDAKAMRDKLKSIGFNVLYAEDASTEEMDKILDEFYEKLQGCDIGLFYFSGHGIESNGANYLLPISSKIKDESDLKRNAVDLSETLSDASYSGAKQLVFIIDACRNNPLKRIRGGSRGLSVVANSDVSHSIVVCACGSGKTADDGNRDHSPFTQALLDHIADSGKSFTDVVRDVKKDVNAATNGSQIPEISLDNTIDAIFLNGDGGNDEKKRDNYRDDSSLNSGVVYLCLGLFCVLLVVMIACFAVFTDRGKEFVAIAKDNAFRTAKKIYELSKEKIVAAREILDTSVLESKRRFEMLKAQRKQSAEEKQKWIEEEKRRIENFILPSVKLNDLLYVAKTPVTVAQYKAAGGICDAVQDDFPVTKVTWLEGAKFFNELSKKENLDPVYDLSDLNNVKVDLSKNGWRFPTEREWKKLASGCSSDLESSAWYNGNSTEACHPCGQKIESKKGLYDVYGLVWEWCSDSIKGKYILKGGAWDCSKKQCNKSSRLNVVPNFRSDAVGLRGVRNI